MVGVSNGATVHSNQQKTMNKDDLHPSGQLPYNTVDRQLTISVTNNSDIFYLWLIHQLALWSLIFSAFPKWTLNKHK
jgi:hypothetical protein